MNNRKELHLCTNIDELEKHSHIPDTKTKNMPYLLRSGCKLHDSAEKAYLEGDEEAAYIFYMRYFNLLNIIRHKPDYHNSKVLIRETLGDKRKHENIMNRLEAITQSLRDRYANLKEVKVPFTVKENQDNYDLNNHRSRSSSPKVPSNEINNRLMKCDQLYNLMLSNKVLIMDCRSSKDYKKSHLSYQHSLNVPSEIIQVGMSAGRLQDKLDADTKVLWSARAVKDHVVLMDWNCATADPPGDAPITILLGILQNWDPDVTYRSPIKIVENGYENFIIMYPHLCTNPVIRSPQSTSISNVISELQLIEYVEYPSVNDIKLKDDIIAKNNQQQENKQQKHYFKALEKPFSNNAPRPLVDRSTKSAAVNTYTDKKMLEQIEREQEDLLKKAEQNDLQLNLALKQCITHRVYDKPQNQRSASEQQLLYNVMQFESVAEDYKNEIIRLKEELKQYLKRDEETVQNVEQTAKQIEEKLNERQRIYSQRDRERNLRSTLFHNLRPSDSEVVCPANKIMIDKTTECNKENIVENTNSPESEQVHISPPVTSLPQFDRSVKPLKAPDFHIVDKYAMSNRSRDFSPIHGTVGRGLTGLKNLGNTCYMNSIIQCLSHTPQLVEYCISDKYKNYISRNNKTKGQVIEELAALIKVLWKGTYKCVSSKDLRYVIGQYQNMFKELEQQDSHEFLTILMDWLHSDLQTLPAADYTRESITASDKAWLDFTKAKESIILNLFYGQIKSIVKCINCNKESATYDCFSNLSLDLPENNNTCSLMQCLDMYFSGERIYGWNCPSCKVKNNAVKKLDIAKLPAVLVIHLKRFSVGADSINPSYKKKQNFLRFPLNNLDMSPHITIAESKRNTPKLYQLYAVSNHYGSMESGHYTAFCKNDVHGRWFKFDDQVVTPLDPTNVISSAAYILFYTRLPPLQITNEY